MVRRDQCWREQAGSVKLERVDEYSGYTGPLWLRNLVGALPMGMFEGLTAVSLDEDQGKPCDDDLAELVPRLVKCAAL